ncbi:MAG: protease HtpX [Pseudomonadota bacterium]
MLRIGLFLGTNFAVMIVLSIVLQVLGLHQQGTSGFIMIAGLFGMGGAFISLMMSKTMAKRAVGAEVIEAPRNSSEQWLIETVARQSEQAGIGMPEVAVFSSDAPNAFATGANRNDALVAVSSGLLKHMNQDEVEAVLGHEVSHVANGDMVTLALLQGVMNTFVMVFAHILAAAIDRNSRGRGMGYFMGYYAAQAVLGILASIVVKWFSRFREYRADAGGAALSSHAKMIAALERLQQQSEPAALPESMAAQGISGLFGGLLSTHPPLSARIEALKQAA